MTEARPPAWFSEAIAVVPDERTTRVKGCDISAFPLVGAAVDQTMHIVALFALALLAAS